MKYVTAIFWGIIFSLIISFIAAPLTSVTANYPQSLIMGLIFSFLVTFILPPIMKKEMNEKNKAQK